ncbi:MAG: hypothetical protein AB2806_04160 [Candidatus Thiodiazotropha sp.]
MYTLHKNNKNQLELQADQKEHDLQIQADQTVHEVNSLRVALKSELTSVRVSYESIIDTYHEEEHTGSSVFQNAAYHVVFDNIAAKLGLLSEDEIDKVIKAYRLVSEVPYKLKMMVRIDKAGHYNDDYIVLNQDATEIAVKIYEVTLY